MESLFQIYNEYWWCVGQGIWSLTWRSHRQPRSMALIAHLYSICNTNNIQFVTWLNIPVSIVYRSLDIPSNMFHFQATNLTTFPTLNPYWLTEGQHVEAFDWSMQHEFTPSHQSSQKLCHLTIHPINLPDHLLHQPTKYSTQSFCHFNIPSQHLSFFLLFCENFSSQYPFHMMSI